MPSQHAIELFALINFAIIGLSLLLQPLAWVRLSEWIRREGEAGAIACGICSLLFGSLIVAFHRVWFGLLIVLTLVGWLQVIKGVIFLLAPGAGLKLMAIASPERCGLLRFAGLIWLALAIFIFVVLLPGRI
jgi:hypothetical protein